MKKISKDSSLSLEKFYLGEAEALQRLNEFDRQINEKRHTFLGYPCNADFKLEKFFKWLEKSSVSKSPLNEVGDPITESWYTLNARPFEMTVLQYFADVFSLHPFWGYISSGGTQSNEQGLYMGREALAKFGAPVLYFAEEAHYSIPSLGKVLGLECRVINSMPSGEMNCDDLKKQLQPNRPALFSLSIGTTFKGGIDRIEVIDPIVRNKGVQHVFYHADAALFGGFLPFYPDPNKPDLNFQKYPYDSIAISGHKFFGAPTPLGIFLIRYEHIHTLEAEYIEYIRTHNLTIPCSRSALNTLIFWWHISTVSQKEFTRQAIQIIENAIYFYEQLRKRNYPAWLNPYSNTLYFKAPSLDLCRQWTLSLFTCRQLGPLAHVIIMQHVTREIIDAFLKDFDRDIHFD